MNTKRQANESLIRKIILIELFSKSKTFETNFNNLTDIYNSELKIPFCIFLFIKTARKVAEKVIEDENLRAQLFHKLKGRKSDFSDSIWRRIDNFKGIKDPQTSIYIYGILLNFILTEISQNNTLSFGDRLYNTLK